MYSGMAEIFPAPPLSQERVELRTSNLARILTGFIPAKAFKNLEEKGALAYPWTAEIFSVFPIISGMGKAAKFKFGRYTD